MKGHKQSRYSSPKSCRCAKSEQRPYSYSEGEEEYAKSELMHGEHDYQSYFPEYIQEKPAAETSDSGDDSFESDGSLSDYTLPDPSSSFYHDPNHAAKKAKKDAIVMAKHKGKHGHNGHCHSKNSCRYRSTGYTPGNSFLTPWEKEVNSADELACPPEKSFKHPKFTERPDNLSWEEWNHIREKARRESTREDFWSDGASDCEEDPNNPDKCTYFKNETAWRHKHQWADQYAIQEHVDIEQGPQELGKARYFATNPYDNEEGNGDALSENNQEALNEMVAGNPKMEKLIADNKKQQQEQDELGMVRVSTGHGSWVTRTPDLYGKQLLHRIRIVPLSTRPNVLNPKPSQSRVFGAPPVAGEYFPPRHDPDYEPLPDMPNDARTTLYSRLDPSQIYSVRENHLEHGARLMPPNSGFVANRAQISADDAARGGPTTRRSLEPLPLGAPLSSCPTTGGSTLHADSQGYTRSAQGTNVSFVGSGPKSSEPSHGWGSSMVDDMINGGAMPYSGDTHQSYAGSGPKSDNPTSGWKTRVDDTSRGAQMRNMGDTRQGHAGSGPKSDNPTSGWNTRVADSTRGAQMRNMGDTRKGHAGSGPRSDNPTSGWLSRVQDMLNGAGQHNIHDENALVGQNAVYPNARSDWTDPNTGDDRADGIVKGGRMPNKPDIFDSYKAPAAMPSTGRADKRGCVPNIMQGFKERLQMLSSAQYMQAKAPAPAYGDDNVNTRDGLGVNRRDPLFAETLRGGRSGAHAGEFSAGQNLENHTHPQFSVCGAGNYGKGYRGKGANGCRMGGRAGFSQETLKDMLQKYEFKNDTATYDPRPSDLSGAVKWGPGLKMLLEMKDPENYERFY